MTYSPLWLNRKPLAAPPAYLRAIAPALMTPQGMTALEELSAGFAALGGKAPAFLGEADGACLVLREIPGGGEGFTLRRDGEKLILTASGAGMVFGAFYLLRRLACGESCPEAETAPRYDLRMLDHWDNADGVVERGYAGSSFFFENGAPVCNARTRDYARLLASCGLNGCCINNVNVKGAALRLLMGDFNETLSELGEQFAEYGVGLWLSVSFAAPMEQGGLPTADPLDAAVRAWWKETAARLFSEVTNLRGFLVKADSEGRPGPQSYGRTQADGANLLAEAVKPFGGEILWRCFVYDCQQDWRDTVRDRARAQCDTFRPLDGQFADNVILQLKNGPVDFQIREPVSPLFGHLTHTRSMVEFQIAQEYTGQQRHVCYLLPMFREVLDFRLWHRAENDRVRDTVEAVTAVSNLGNDYNWTGHDLAAANLFGFGLLSWDPEADPGEIAREWSILTFGADKTVTDTVADILLRSREIYERYSTPMGIGWMVNPGDHYGPNPEGYEYDRWGTYHRATCKEIGVERGSSGTDFVSQYHSPLREMYDDPATCPENLLLFFHRLPYDHIMQDGRTLLQTWYDSHFEGYEAAESLARAWDGLEGKIEEGAFRRVQERFREQLRSAKEWRDVINSWLYRLTLIPDEKGRTLYL